MLLEAATVARTRAGTTPQIERAIGYLEAIHHTDFATHRVLGMLTEFCAMVGNRDRYERYRARATEYEKAHTRALSPAQRDSFREAIKRADSYFAPRA